MDLKQKIPTLKPDKHTLAKVRQAGRNPKVRLAAAAVVILAALGFGVVQFLQYKASTLETAVERLNLAIANRDVEATAHLIDVVELARGLATVIVETSDQPDAEALDAMESRIQHRLLELFTATTEASHAEEPRLPPGYTPPVKPPNPMDDPVFDILKKPVHVLPPDLMIQLAEKPFTILAAETDLAVVETSVEHHQLGVTLPLRLSMIRNEQSGWQVRTIASARDMVTLFRNRVDELAAQAVMAFDAENARLRALMNTYYHVENCRAVFFPPDAEDVVRLRLIVTGVNQGDRDLVSSAALCEMLDQDENVLGSLRLENTRSVRAGDAFEHAWFYTFETRYPEIEAMLAAQSVSCRATPVTISLGKGQLLYPRRLEDYPGVRIVE